MRSTVPLKLAVLLKLGRNFVDSRLPQKRSNPLPLQLRGACPPGSMKPPESGTKPQKSYQLNCSNSDCFIDFLVFLWANLATDCSTFAFLKVTLRPGFKPKKVHRHSYKSYCFWISFSGFPPRWFASFGFGWFCFDSLSCPAAQAGCVLSLKPP